MKRRRRIEGIEVLQYVRLDKSSREVSAGDALFWKNEKLFTVVKSRGKRAGFAIHAISPGNYAFISKTKTNYRIWREFNRS